MRKEVKIICLAVLVLVVMVCSVQAARDGLVAPDVRYVDDYTLAGPVNYLTDVDPADRDGHVHVIVEIPSGTRAKWEVARDSGNLVWEFKKGKPRTVEYKGGYPANYGMVPKTILTEEMGGEGESVDVILFGKQQKRGSVVKARLIGVLKIQEGDGAFDDKLLAVAEGTPEYSVKDLDELNARFNNIGNVVKEWFANYKGPDSGLKVRGTGSPDEARRLFYAAMKAHSGAN